MAVQRSLSGVDQKVKRLVFGYMRQNEHEIDRIIPPIIFYTCLMFYWIKEYFDLMAENINASKDKLRITYTANATLANAAYGAKKIQSTQGGVHKWTLSMHEFGDFSLIGFSDKERTDTAFIWNTDANYYGTSIRMHIRSGMVMIIMDK